MSSPSPVPPPRPAPLAFRVLRKLLEDEMGVEEANKRIYATTDRAKGTLEAAG